MQMLYIIITTPQCNLQCKYCGGSLHGMPPTITYQFSDLYDFIKGDKEAVVAFYGGEPLLNSEVIKYYIEHLTARHYVINTNGYFIESLGESIHMFDTILLSVDGRKQVTDYYRQPGCYDKVISAVHFLKDHGFSGELIARMAVSRKTDIYEDVTHLLSIFPYVHWQLDMIWSSLWELHDFKIWKERSYNPGIKQLIFDWVENIKHDTIQGVIPFLGIASRMLYGGSGLYCQSGTRSVTITTDGKILGCPIAPDFSWNELGSLQDGFQCIDIGEPCIDCVDYQLCGGRCLFAHREWLWGKEGFLEMCSVTRFLIHELLKFKDLFYGYKERLLYPLFNNTTEIIP